MAHATHDAAYMRDYRARAKGRPAEPPSWYELGQAMPSAMVEALLEGMAKCSPEPLRERQRTRVTPSSGAPVCAREGVTRNSPPGA